MPFGSSSHDVPHRPAQLLNLLSSGAVASPVCNVDAPPLPSPSASASGGGGGGGAAAVVSPSTAPDLPDGAVVGSTLDDVVYVDAAGGDWFRSPPPPASEQVKA